MLRLTQELIDKMVADKHFHEFEFLASPPRMPVKLTEKEKALCRTCAKRKRKLLAAKGLGKLRYGDIRKKIVELPPDKTARLKELLGTTNLVVYYRDDAGALQEPQV